MPAHACTRVRAGESALHCAVRANALHVVSALLAGGASLDVR
jgi:ankyrin repeat protein